MDFSKKRTPKDFLKQIDLLDEMIKCNKQELENLRDLSVSITGGGANDVRVKSSNDVVEARFTNVIHQIMELEKAIVSDTEKALEIKLEVRTAISKLEKSNERLLLNYKYIQGMTWTQVCSAMTIAETTAYRIHGSALKNLQYGKGVIGSQ